VFAGMTMATILGVLLVPVLFVVIERLGGKKHPPAPVVETKGGGH
jgi:hypothetical protein